MPVMPTAEKSPMNRQVSDRSFSGTDSRPACHRRSWRNEPGSVSAASPIWNAACAEHRIWERYAGWRKR